jgi:hypothetical protein
MTTLKQLLQAYRANVNASLRTEFDGELWSAWWDGNGDYPDTQGINSESFAKMLQTKLLLKRDTLQRSIATMQATVKDIDEVLK